MNLSKKQIELISLPVVVIIIAAFAASIILSQTKQVKSPLIITSLVASFALGVILILIYQSRRNDLNPKPLPTTNKPVIKWIEGIENESKGTKKSDGWYTNEDLKSGKGTIFLFGANITHFIHLAYGNGHAQLVDSYGYGGNKENAPNTGLMFPILTMPLERKDSENNLTTEEWKALNNELFDTLKEYVRYGGKVIIPCLHNGETSMGTGTAQGVIPDEVKKSLDTHCTQLTRTHRTTETKPNIKEAHVLIKNRLDCLMMLFTNYHKLDPNMSSHADDIHKHVKAYAQYLVKKQQKEEPKSELRVLSDLKELVTTQHPNYSIDRLSEIS